MAMKTIASKPSTHKADYQIFPVMVFWFNTIEATTKASTMDPLRPNIVRDAKTAF